MMHWRNGVLLALWCALVPLSNGWADGGALPAGLAELKLAAEQGDGAAALRLGDLYRLGQGIAQDNNEAFRWYQKGAELGNGTANSRLGDAWQFGRGVTVDFVAALRAYNQALASGDGHAAFQMGRMVEAGHTEKFADAQRLYAKAAELKDPDGLAELSYQQFSQTGSFAGAAQQSLAALDAASQQPGAVPVSLRAGITGRWNCAISGRRYVGISLTVTESGGAANISYDLLSYNLGHSVSRMSVNGAETTDQGDFTPGPHLAAFFDAKDKSAYPYENTYRLLSSHHMLAGKIPLSGKDGAAVVALCRKLAEADGSLLNY